MVKKADKPRLVCLKALVHYILTGQGAVNEGDKDVFKVSNV